MTADCVFNSWNVQTNFAFLYFAAGEFTINGNGHSIIGPTNGFTIYVQNDGTVLNLNDVTIRQGGSALAATLSVDAGRLNARNIIFRDNQSNIILTTSGSSGQGYLENVQFLNNHGIGASPLVVTAGSNSFIRITNGIFQGNTGFNSMIDSVATIQLRGCFRFAGNEGNRYSARSTGITDDSSCPKRKKEEKIPTATPTSRPLAVTCPALSQFGIAVHATYGLASGVQCQRLDSGGIGIQSIVEAGFIEAVDIWGYVEQGVEVCFPQMGRVIFLDARTMPRAITALESTIVNGMTCVYLNSPGSLVLLPN